jgi:hypothetical protein
MPVAESILDSYEAFAERLQQALNLDTPEMHRMAKDLSVRRECILTEQKDVNLHSGMVIKLVESVLGFDHTAEKLLRLKNDCSQTELGMAMRSDVDEHTKALDLEKYKQLDLMATHCDALRYTDIQRLRGVADVITMISQLAVTEDNVPIATLIDRLRSDTMRSRTTSLGEELNVSSSDSSGSELSPEDVSRKASFEKLQTELEGTRRQLLISHKVSDRVDDDIRKLKDPMQISSKSHRRLRGKLRAT